MGNKDERHNGNGNGGDHHSDVPKGLPKTRPIDPLILIAQVNGLVEVGQKAIRTGAGTGPRRGWSKFGR